MNVISFFVAVFVKVKLNEFRWRKALISLRLFASLLTTRDCACFRHRDPSVCRL